MKDSEYVGMAANSLHSKHIPSRRFSKTVNKEHDVTCEHYHTRNYLPLQTTKISYRGRFVAIKNTTCRVDVR